MATSLITQFTTARSKTPHYFIYQAKDSATYTGVTNGTILLPAGSLVTLVSSGNVSTTKLSGAVDTTWALSEGVTVSSSSVSTALSTKASIVALTADASPTATDLATSLVMVNSLKTKVNAIIAALKTA